MTPSVDISGVWRVSVTCPAIRGGVMMPVYLTCEEAAARLKCSTQVLRRLLRSGELQGVKLAKQWRITEDAVVTYMTALAERQGGNK
jgi:excisionase family DNA binding protein